MKTRELIKYAQDNGYDSVKFWCKEKLIAGQFMDAFFEFVKIPLLGENAFISISQIEERFGYDLEFEIVTDEEEYKKYVLISFILRGRQAPEQYIC